MTVQELYKELQKALPGIENITYISHYDRNEEMCRLEYDRTNPEEVFLKRELSEIVGYLNNAAQNMNYLDKPVKEEGTLVKDENGRYCIGNKTLTSGHCAEFLLPIESDEEGNPVYTWVFSRVEHNGKDYYIYRYPQFSMQGIRARYR